MATERESGNPPPPPPSHERSERSRTRAELAELVVTSPGVVRLDPIFDGRRHGIWLLLAVLFALLGAVLSFELSMRFFHQQTALSTFSAPFCGEEGGACDRVSQSKWGRIEFNAGGRRVYMSTAMIGLTYFGFLSLWYLFVGRSNYPGRAWHLIPLVLALAGAGVSGWLTYAMYRVLEVVCPLCMAVHVVNWLLLVVTVALWPGRGEVRTAPVPVTPIPSGRLVATGLALALFAGFSGTKVLETWLSRVRGNQTARMAELLNGFYRDGDLMAYVWRREQPVEIPVDASDAIRNSADAEHTVVVFSDFYCTACLNAAKLLHTQVDRLPDVSIRFVYKYWPMDRECNDQLKATKFAGACEASLIAEAILQRRGDDAFWRFHDAVFAAQDELGPSRVRELAAEAGLPAAEIDAAMRDTSVEGRVRACIELGRSLSITRHPTVFLDGRRVEAWHELSTWEAILGVKSVAPASQPLIAAEDLSS